MSGIKLSIKSKLQIMLLIASLGSILVVGYLSWNKANGILTERIFSELTVVRTSKAYQIESYLNLFRKQIETLCENKMVVEAMREFDTEFDRLEQASITLDSQKKIESYYNQEFLPRLAKNIDGTPVYETYSPTQPQSLYLQYHYIANNSHPVGQKDELERAEDNSKYSEIHESYHYLFRNLIKRFGYYDLFLIDAETGDIVYSVYKETDYATSLYTDAYRNSNLAKIAKQVRDNPDRGAIQLVDFEFYRPSYNAPAAFIAGPIYDGTRRVGILAVQLPIDEINLLLTENQHWQEDGLGETGETYLVGEDLRLRSISRLFIENTAKYLEVLRQNRIRDKTVSLIEQLKTPVLLQPVETIAAKEAIAGKRGTQIIDSYGGKKVLSSYAPLDLDGVNWGIVSEISLSEAYAPLDSLQRYLLLSIVILILLVTLFAAIAAQRFTRPIDLMIERLRNLDKDEIADLELTSNDEFRELAQILNTIGQRVRALTKSIMEKEGEKEALLLNILPAPVVKRWKKGEQVVDKAQVVIIAIRVGGLEKAKQRSATKIAQAYNELITLLDSKGEQVDVERLNCFGESYIAVCGLNKPRLDRIKRGVDFANDGLNLVKEINRKYNLSLNLRIGIDAGLITAALIGEEKFRYDIWGKPVNVATQLAQKSEANTIRVTQTVRDRVKDMFDFQSDNSITLSDKSNIATWVLGKTGMSDLIGEITFGLDFDEDDNDDYDNFGNNMIEESI
ncbi:MAG: adenylate/guanylate cyclase domain-containing protein [Cyanobacteria bacterium P01_A01_bin.40]